MFNTGPKGDRGLLGPPGEGVLGEPGPQGPPGLPVSNIFSNRVLLHFQEIHIELIS